MKLLLLLLLLLLPAVSLPCSAAGPRYLLSRAEPETEASDGMVMLHYDLWMLGVPGPGADGKMREIKGNEPRNYTASIGIGINHPPSSVNHAARYYNSWGQQALQLQAGAAAQAQSRAQPGGAGLTIKQPRTQTDGTGVNWVFHPELWPRLDAYFATLASLATQHAISPATIKVIRIGMDKTGEFNYPYSSIVGGGVTNNTWWAFDAGGRPFADYPKALRGWRPGAANSPGGNESATFVSYYYAKLAAFQDYMVRTSLKHFPLAYPAVLMPGSSAAVRQADVAAAVATLGRGEMRSLGPCSHGDCPFPISAGWARYLLIPPLARSSSKALAWHTGCEQQFASGVVFAEAAKVGLRVGCENSGGIFDQLNGSAYQAAVSRFLQWSVAHDAAVTFLITEGSAFYSDTPAFLQCEQRQFASGELTPACFGAYCTRCKQDARGAR